MQDVRVIENLFHESATMEATVQIASAKSSLTVVQLYYNKEGWWVLLKRVSDVISNLHVLGVPLGAGR